MGKGKFDCFEGHKRCETVTFTDAGGNSFSMKVYQRSYNKGTASYSWESASFTYNGTPSNGPFTGSKVALECGFKSSMTMTSFRHPLIAQVVIDDVTTLVPGYMTFNSSGYPVITFFAYNTTPSTPGASTAATVYGGSLTYPQGC